MPCPYFFVPITRIMEIFAGFIMFLVVIGIVGLVILAIVWYYYAEKKRREALMRLADNLGLTYIGTDPNGKDSVYSNISLFQNGHSKEASNIISGDKNGCYVDIFDYKYVTGSGKHRTTHYNSVCILAVPQRFRYLFVRTENFLDKIAGAIGFDDIDFESREFSKRYYVKSDDKKFAYDIINPQMMEFFLAQQKTPCVEIKGNHLAFYMNKKISPKEYIVLYSFAEQFYRRIPNYVLEEYK